MVFYCIYSPFVLLIPFSFLLLSFPPSTHLIPSHPSLLSSPSFLPYCFPSSFSHSSFTHSYSSFPTNQAGPPSLPTGEREAFIAAGRSEGGGWNCSRSAWRVISLHIYDFHFTALTCLSRLCVFPSAVRTMHNIRDKRRQ